MTVKKEEIYSHFFNVWTLSAAFCIAHVNYELFYTIEYSVILLTSEIH